VGNNNYAFQINPGGNVTVIAAATTTNAGAPVAAFGFHGSHDGTNWVTSTSQYSGTVTLGGSNTTTASSFTFTNVPFNYLRWASFGHNQTAAVAVATMQVICK